MEKTSTSTLLNYAIEQIQIHAERLAEHEADPEVVEAAEALAERARSVLREIAAFGDLLGDVLWIRPL